jgi:hypothetical protein
MIDTHAFTIWSADEVLDHEAFPIEIADDVTARRLAVLIASVQAADNDTHRRIVLVMLADIARHVLTHAPAGARGRTELAVVITAAETIADEIRPRSLPEDMRTLIRQTQNMPPDATPVQIAACVLAGWTTVIAEREVRDPFSAWRAATELLAVLAHYAAGTDAFERVHARALVTLFGESMPIA